MTRRQMLGAMAGCALGHTVHLHAAASAAAAAAAPASLRLLLVYPPGGVTDSFARVLAPALGQALGQTVWLDHRPGAGGVIGLRALKAAAPDGTTLCLSAITPLTLAGLVQPFSPDTIAVDDVVPVAALLRTPSLLVGTPALAASSFEAMLDLATRARAPLRWATSGYGTTGHLMLSQIQKASGAAFIHVPYQGGGPQLNDALGGHFELLSTNVALQQLGYIRERRLQALAVGAPSRLAALPEVPTLAECGHADANRWSLFGLFAPPATPAPLIAQLNQAANHALSAPEVVQHIAEAHLQSAAASVQAFEAEISREQARNRALLTGYI